MDGRLRIPVAAMPFARHAAPMQAVARVLVERGHERRRLHGQAGTATASKQQVPSCCGGDRPRTSMTATCP
jgi:hypothetical protein